MSEYETEIFVILLVFASAFLCINLWIAWAVAKIDEALVALRIPLTLFTAGAGLVNAMNLFNCWHYLITGAHWQMFGFTAGAGVACLCLALSLRKNLAGMFSG